MAYVKNEDPWAADDIVTPAYMDNFEKIYTESASYLSSHTHDASYYTKAEMQAKFWYAGNDGPASGADADLIYKSTGNLHAASFAGLGVPTGLVVMWSGGAVPSGWHLCDGNAGTVNLLNKFVIGAGTGSDYAVGAEGTGVHAPSGSMSIGGHALTTAEIKGHQHTYNDKYGAYGAGSGYWNGSSGFAYATGPWATGRTTGNSSVGKTPADAHTHDATFTGNNFTALPPYYALAFIQKS
jgi:hypothetical protein